MRSSLALIVLAGCGASPPVRPAPATTTRDHAPVYEAVFRGRQSWHYRVESTWTEYLDEPDPTTGQDTIDKTEVSSATCTSSDAERSASGVSVRVTCSGDLSHAHVQDWIPVAGEFLEGTWDADSAGLWLTHNDSTLGRSMVIVADPTPGRKEFENPDGEGSEAVVVERHGNIWCVVNVSCGGDCSGDTYCFADQGIVAGRRQFVGGSFSEIKFCLEERLCRELPNN